jgi:hypothetical protein
MMQINSSHFGELAAYGITRERLLREPCLRINVGAQVLSGAYAHHARRTVSDLSFPILQAFMHHFGCRISGCLSDGRQ